MLGGSNDHVIHSVLQPLALSVFKDWAGDAISHFSLPARLGVGATATYSYIRSKQRFTSKLAEEVSTVLLVLAWSCSGVIDDAEERGGGARWSTGKARLGIGWCTHGRRWLAPQWRLRHHRHVHHQSHLHTCLSTAATRAHAAMPLTPMG